MKMKNKKTFTRDEILEAVKKTISESETLSIDEWNIKSVLVQFVTNLLKI